MSGDGSVRHHGAVPLYRCYGRMDGRGRWRAWRFAPATSGEHARQVTDAAGAGHVLFASVQRFAAPRGQAAPTHWRQVRDQYTGDEPLPHLAPLYFDIDVAGDLDKALLWARELVAFFTGQLALGESGVRVWFSGSKGAHVLVDPVALGIEPSAFLTADMKVVARQLVEHLTTMGLSAIAVDSSVYSLPRMLRVPDQLNHKSGLHKVELAHRELMTCSAAEITTLAHAPRGPRWSADALPAEPIATAARWWSSALARARQPREFRIKTAEVAGLKVRPDGYVLDELTSDAMPKCIQRLFDVRPSAGSRNRCELQIACWAKAAKQPLAKALSLLGGWTARNRPELSAENAQRQAESVVRSVYGNPAYGFSCAAARAAARGAGVDDSCRDCPAHRQQQRQVSSLRVRHDAQWCPDEPFALEHSRGLIAAAIDERVARASLNTAGGAGDGAARFGQDLCHAPGPRRSRQPRRLCDAHA